MHFDFPRTLGQDDAKTRLSLALASARFPHALLVHGEPGLGQHALLLDIAQILSCEAASDSEKKPCGTCFPCRGFDASALETLHHLIPITKKDRASDGDDDEEAGPESGQIDELGESISSWHARPYGYDVPEKAIVRMSQARELIGRLRYSEGGGRARVVLVPWLESLTPETANALLKTLEEPPANVYFLIASDHRSGLMQTLLSRCLHLSLSPLAPADFRRAAETLSTRLGKPLAARLLPFAEGSPGVYVDLLENDGEELLEEALRFLSATSDWRVFADFAAETSPGAEGMEQTARLLHFLLRMLRAYQLLKATATNAAGASLSIPEALTQMGWEPSLAAYLGAFDTVVDLQAFAVFLEDAYRAIRAYSKPSIALVGLFLEYEAKASRNTGVAA
jgi:DNA polymerase III delta prime subunit